MSFPGPNQPPSNGGGNKPNGGNNPFTNPFSRNNDGKNGGSGANGNKSNGPRPFWQSPLLCTDFADHMVPIQRHLFYHL